MLEIPNETRLGGWGGNAADMSFKSGHACQPGFDNVTEHQIWKKRHHFLNSTCITGNFGWIATRWNFNFYHNIS